MWLILGAAWACPATVDAQTLPAAVEGAETHWRSLDAPAFRGAMAQLPSQLACHPGRIDGPLSARVHRLQVLLATADGRDPGLQMDGMMASDPALTLTDVLAPGHPLLDRQPTPRTHAATVPLPPRWGVRFDGQADERPLSRATLAQVHGPGHLEARYLLPGDPLPQHPRPAPAAWWTAGVLGTAGAALFAGGLASRAGFDAPADTVQALEARQSRTNALLASGMSAAGGGAVALGVGFWVRSRGPVDAGP